jgi:hypothetical protein
MKRRFEELTKQCSNSVLPVTWFGTLDRYDMRGEKSVLIKAEPAMLGGWQLHNASSGRRWLKFYDQRTKPEADKPFAFTIMLEPGPNPCGLHIPFFAGLGFVIDGVGTNPALDVSGVILFA